MTDENKRQYQGLWKSKTGQKFEMSGTLRNDFTVEGRTIIPAGYTVFIWKNDRKVNGSQQPDYQLSIAPPRT